MPFDQCLAFLAPMSICTLEWDHYFYPINGFIHINKIMIGMKQDESRTCHDHMYESAILTV